MKIAIIGAGNMGGAIVRGLSVFSKDMQVAISNRSHHKLDLLKKEYPQIEVSTDNNKVAENADVLILAVKPWLVENVLRKIADEIDLSHTIILSVAAGVSIDNIKRCLPNIENPVVFLVMPNTAISVGQSMTFVAHSDNATNRQTEVVKEIFDAMGRTAIIEEKQMPATTALCSCGIAFAMRYVRAATEGGVELGINACQAKDYVVQTLRGAAELLESTGNHPEVEIDKVTTPGGITIRGLNAMEANGFTNAVIQGLKSSK